MKTVGIIAEYNPFHNGHAYLLHKARQLTGADHCIVIMSGDYTQRGEPALMDKYERTKMALAGGADLVLELPVCFSCASASRFADGAVSLLDALGVVDNLVFGSECGEIHLLEEVASLLAPESPAYAGLLREKLRLGYSYPLAQATALQDCIRSARPDRLHTLDDTALSLLLSSSNNILGIEYCKSLRTRGSSIRPITIARRGSYLDCALPAGHDDSVYASATAVRTALLAERLPKPDTGAAWPGALSAADFCAGEAGQTLHRHIPDYVYEIMQESYGRTFPISPDMLSQMLHYKLLSEAGEGFAHYLDVSDDLSDRIRRLLPHYRSFTSFCTLLKTKEVTYSRISRSLLHILLQIRTADLQQAESQGIPYARMLGFRQSAAPLLTALKASASIPLISKLADAENYISQEAAKLLQKDIQAAHLYNALILHAYGTLLPEETRRQIVRV